MKTNIRKELLFTFKNHSDKELLFTIENKRKEVIAYIYGYYTSVYNESSKTTNVYFKFDLEFNVISIPNQSDKMQAVFLFNNLVHTWGVDFADSINYQCNYVDRINEPFKSTCDCKLVDVAGMK